MIRKYLAILAVVALAGCATEGGDKSTSSTQPAPKGASGNSTQGLDSNEAGNGRALGSDGSDAALAAAMKDHTVYFAYDSSEISSDGMAVVAAFGKYLSANPGTKLRLEGNTDERGSREYNVGLGERRAIAVQAALVARGATPGQLAIISYGEERPAVAEHDEAAYAKNRRVEIVRQ
jgi:peptidoglycan-associated lipoprotein